MELAEFYHDSGFSDVAGKYWILTEQTDERIKNIHLRKGHRTILKFKRYGDNVKLMPEDILPFYKINRTSCIVHAVRVKHFTLVIAKHLSKNERD